jgi:hypothetical protein
MPGTPAVARPIQLIAAAASAAAAAAGGTQKHSS